MTFSKKKQTFFLNNSHLVELGNQGDVILTKYTIRDSIRISGFAYVNDVYTCFPFTIYYGELTKKHKLNCLKVIGNYNKSTFGSFYISLPLESRQKGYLIFDYIHVNSFGFWLNSIKLTEPYYCPEIEMQYMRDCLD